MQLGRYFWSSLRVCVLAHLVAVQCVLGSAGCQRDGVWLAAAFTLTVKVLSIPNRHTSSIKGASVNEFEKRVCDCIDKTDLVLMCITLCSLRTS